MTARVGTDRKTHGLNGQTSSTFSTLQTALLILMERVSLEHTYTSFQKYCEVPWRFEDSFTDWTQGSYGYRQVVRFTKLTRPNGGRKFSGPSYELTVSSILSD